MELCAVLHMALLTFPQGESDREGLFGFRGASPGKSDGRLLTCLTKLLRGRLTGSRHIFRKCSALYTVDPSTLYTGRICDTQVQRLLYG